VDLWKEALIRDIRDGTLDRDIEPAVRADLAPRLRPDSARAAELERLAARHDVLRPADYWPRLRLVHTWKNGNCALVIPKLRPWFGEATPILDFGYLASEITATDLLDPATDGSILQVRSAFYEFAPYDDSDQRIGSKLLAHELDVGRRYYIFVSTFSGLYRYDMNDVVEVVGKFKQVPIIRFLFKGKGVTSITGEKLSEQQLIEAVQRAAGETGVDHDFFIGYADAERQQYKLYIDLLGRGSPAVLSVLAAALDRALMAVNVEYTSKRKSARLQAPIIIDAGKTFFDRYKASRLADGASEGQFKWLNLTSDPKLDARLDQLAGSATEGRVCDDHIFSNA
jgi:hypothetical protein